MIFQSYGTKQGPLNGLLVNLPYVTKDRLQVRIKNAQLGHRIEINQLFPFSMRMSENTPFCRHQYAILVSSPRHFWSLRYVYTLRLIGPISYLGGCYRRTKVTKCIRQKMTLYFHVWTIKSHSPGMKSARLIAVCKHSIKRHLPVTKADVLHIWCSFV